MRPSLAPAWYVCPRLCGGGTENATQVFVNSQKLACSACIKGHRSSQCSHSDRPLFNVPSRGRPVSQCPKCRELRKTKQHHSKCMCPQELPSRGVLLPSSSSRSRRYIPIQPALPNGLRDMAKSSSSYTIPDARQRVKTLLNPCNCGIGHRCKCRTPPQAGTSSTEDMNDHALTPASTVTPAPSRCPPPGPRLAPILSPSSFATLTASDAPPDPTFGPQLPSMRVMQSLAGSGCTCGVECSCLGCGEHRGPAQAADFGRDGCSACAAPAPVRPATSSIQRFLARAAALPRPPAHRSDVVNLPKFECCGEDCACPDVVCGCSNSCYGGCLDHAQDSTREERAPEQMALLTP
ncbi:copper fist DNA binding domain-containing protein [Mycena vulgaris]|nr:copper fist DNA binding domain-containing protein [Mycena vulgaris]